MFDQWKKTCVVRRLYAQLKSQGIEPEWTTNYYPKNPFIHPSMTPHLTWWLGGFAHLVSIYELQRSIARMGRPSLLPPPTPQNGKTFCLVETHESNNNHLTRFLALECKSRHYHHHITKILASHPHMVVILLCEGVALDTQVIKTMRHDYETMGNICINRKNYCGSSLCKPALLNLLIKFCKVSKPVAIMEVDFDVVDNYEYVV
jgi:hypothetical protein